MKNYEKMERQASDWEKIFADLRYEKELTTRIYIKKFFKAQQQCGMSRWKTLITPDVGRAVE